MRKFMKPFQWTIPRLLKALGRAPAAIYLEGEQDNGSLFGLWMLFLTLILAFLGLAGFLVYLSRGTILIGPLVFILIIDAIRYIGYLSIRNQEQHLDD